ncbi:MAG: cystathionine beta-lyase [Pigmentiphaga sp.]
MKPETRLVHLGREPQRFEGLVNVPPCRTSTYLHDSVAAYQAAAADKHGRLYYGRFGSQTSLALASACAELDEAAGAVLFPSGLAAITRVLGCLLRPGDHLLMVDTVYGPVRAFCEQELTRVGVRTSWYSPDDLVALEALVRPETRVVYAESPGSLTFEVQDLRALADVARRHGLVSVVDNTWATPWFCRPLALGMDISLMSGSKYLVGHSDALLGVASSTEPYLAILQQAAAHYGNAVSADDCYLALRGLRTLGIRLARHQASALRVAGWLAARPEIAEVFYPALPGDAYHAIWQRDFSGASGLLGVAFHSDVTERQRHAFVDGLALFGIGVSWGGFESLALPGQAPRRLPDMQPRCRLPLVRLHIGLEDPGDLIADLACSLANHIPMPER